MTSRSARFVLALVVIATPAAARAGTARAAADEVAGRRAALDVVDCPLPWDAAIRKVIAVEMGDVLVEPRQPARPDSDRLFIRCEGVLAHVEARGASGAEATVRTVRLADFPRDAAPRAVALAALEALSALENQRRARASASAAPPPAAGVATIDPAAQAEYQQGFVWFNDSVWISWMGRKWSPYRGKYHEDLDGATFYEAVGRPDLATTYRVRRALRWLAIGGGIAAGFYGLFQFRDHATTASVFFFGGMGAVFVGSLLGSDPVDESGARMLADSHNRALKQKVGLSLGLNF